MRRVLLAGLVVVVCILLHASYGGQASAQEPVIKRSAPMTLTGELVDISCYKSKGVAGGTGAAHVDCARICVLEKGAAVGILTDGDGLFRIWGESAKDKYAKVMPYSASRSRSPAPKSRSRTTTTSARSNLQTVKRKGK